VILRWLNTVVDTCVSFTFFSKTLDLSVAKNGSKQVNNTNLGFLMVELPWYRCHGNMNKNKKAFKIGFVYL